MWRNCVSLSKISVMSSKTVTKQKSTALKLCSCFLKHMNYHSLAKFQTITCKLSDLQNQISVKKLQHTMQQSFEEAVQTEDCNSFTYRSHTCGELRPENVGENVILCGWVQYIRMSRFVLLRDAYGITQCIVGEKNFNLTNVTLESILKIEGEVVLRPKTMINTKMTTGEVEVVISSVETLNAAEKVPFNLRDYQKPKEQLRLQHRYIDLRFPEMQRNLRQRSKMVHNMRRFLVEKHNFVEVETPTLFCHTPGGAREFVVPTHHSGLFYALVQSPQQFKQMLMSGGIDRYFQIARCYRDETTRPDRQPEFTQLDIELSFTSLDKVLTLIEELLSNTFLKSLPKAPFKRITYKEALENYGTDKPNLIYDLKLHNIKHLFSDKVTQKDFEAYALPYPADLGNFTDEDKNKIDDLIRKYNTKIFINEILLKRFGKYFNEKLEEIIGKGNTAILSLGVNDNACLFLGEFRDYLAQLLHSKKLLTIKKNIEPVWVVDFPLFLKGEKGLETCHHPFTAPHPEDLHLLSTDPLRMRSLAYDLVLNGNEVGGGSVRIHDVELQKKILKILKINEGKLTHFLNALSCGCPPHAGIALGIDRLVSLACETESIRDVIAFPKSHDGRDPLSGAPSTISDEDRKYYHLQS